MVSKYYTEESEFKRLSDVDNFGELTETKNALATIDKFTTAKDISVVELCRTAGLGIKTISKWRSRVDELGSKVQTTTLEKIIKAYPDFLSYAPDLVRFKGQAEIIEASDSITKYVNGSLKNIAAEELANYDIVIKISLERKK